MILPIKIAGYLLILLALVHILFARYFNWKEELKPLSLMNRQMMVIHTFFIALIVLLMGLLCVTSAGALTSTEFGKKISMGMAFFWLVRLIVQFVGYSSKLWRGKRFETIVHILFSLLWLFLTVIFFRAAMD